MIKRLIAVLLLAPMVASADITLTELPYHQDFETDDYSDLVRTSGDCSHEWLGATARFTPATTSDQYCGFGQILFGGPLEPEELYITFEFRYGPNMEVQGGGLTDDNKMIILNRDTEADTDRAIMNVKPWQAAGELVAAPCQNTTCRYENGGEFGPDDPHGTLAGDWHRAEFYASAETGRVRLTIDDTVIYDLYDSPDATNTTGGQKRAFGTWIEPGETVSVDGSQPWESHIFVQEGWLTMANTDGFAGSHWGRIDVMGYWNGATASDPDNWIEYRELHITENPVVECY